jgi:chromosomal replication initiator protein
MFMMNAQENWSAAYNQLELQLDRASFDTWLRGAVFLRIEDERFVIGVRNDYAREMLQHRLYRNVRRVLSDVCGQPVELVFEIHKPAPIIASPNEQEEMPLFRLLAQQDTSKPAPPLHEQIVRPERQALSENDLNPRYTFGRYICGTENQMVLAAAEAVANYPGSAYNPLFIYGGVGLGKTHLLHSIAHHCREKRMRAVYIPAEVFTNDLIDAIRQKTTAMFREKYRTADVLLVDDIQFLIGKESTQEEFFHTFNALYTFNKQIVIASDRKPEAIETLESRLKSRFEGGLLIEVQPPDFETRIAIVQQWAQERGIEMSRANAELIAENGRTNVRMMEGYFNHIAATMQLARGKMSEAVVADKINSFERPRTAVSVAQVLAAVSDYYSVSVESLLSDRRDMPLAQQRHIAMYLAVELTTLKKSTIADEFRRAHNSPDYAMKKVHDMLKTDPGVGIALSAIRETLTKQA